MSKLRIATVFSGIGALEESLKQLGIKHVIKFACDNGEREPKQSLSILLKVASETLDAKRVEKLFDNLIRIIFVRKNSNTVIQKEVLEEYEAIKNLSLKNKVKAIDDLYDITYYGTKFSFKLKLNDMADAASFLTEREKNKFVNAWYATTKCRNYVKDSYLANYHIENDAWYEDVRFLNGKKYAGEVDLFVGGSPCQSFSTYGKKLGLEDARGTLFYDYARLIKEIQPKVFIYENVKGLLTHDKKRTWTTIKSIFDSLDYNIYQQVLNAEKYGLPQKRERIFVIGIKKGIKFEFTFPEPISLDKFAPAYLEDIVPNKYYLGKKGFEWVTNKEKNRNKTRYNKNIIGCETANQQDNWIGDLRVEPAKPEHINDPRIHKELLDFNDGNGPILSVARKMTPKECLRLMGFKYFASILNDKQMYRQAGNSIAVPVLNALIMKLQPVLGFCTDFKYELTENSVAL